MRSRLLGPFLAALCFGGGLLYAQGDDLGDFLTRGQALSQVGKYDQALPYFLLALERAEAQYGPESIETVPFLDALAQLFVDQKNYADARPHYERALEIQETALSRVQAEMARTLDRLASLYDTTDRAREAEDLYRRALTASQGVLGAEHPGVQTARRQLGRVQEARRPPPPPQEVARPPPQPPRPPPQRPQRADDYRIHLTSVRRRADVDDEWARLSRIYGRLLAGLELSTVRVDLGAEKGVWHRVLGGLLSRDEARSRCRTFTSAGVWCGVVRPDGLRASVAPVMAANAVANVAPVPAGGFRIHLTSIRSPEDAEQEWSRLSRLHRNLLKGLRLEVERADLGTGRGVWYRIAGGPMSRDAARALCAAFAERNVWCRISGPNGYAADWMLRPIAQRARRRPTATTRSTSSPRSGRRPSHRPRPADEAGCRRTANDHLRHRLMADRRGPTGMGSALSAACEQEGSLTD